MIATWHPANGTWFWNIDHAPTSTDSATGHVPRLHAVTTFPDDMFDKLAATMATELEKTRRRLSRLFRTKKKRGKDTTPTALIYVLNRSRYGIDRPRPRQLASGYG